MAGIGIDCFSHVFTTQATILPIYHCEATVRLKWDEPYFLLIGVYYPLGHSNWFRAGQVTQSEPIQCLTGLLELKRIVSFLKEMWEEIPISLRWWEVKD